MSIFCRFLNTPYHLPLFEHCKLYIIEYINLYFWIQEGNHRDCFTGPLYLWQPAETLVCNTSLPIAKWLHAAQLCCTQD